ncbi:MAG: hypothetical protein ABSA74_01140, partial [Candidatus Staskawiczbacteria bacterium]
MAIKKSSLEKNLFYRIAKVLFVWVPPILVVAALVLALFAGMRGLPMESISIVLQQNISLIIGLAIALAIYFLILKLIWRGFLYIVFGGLEDDTKKKVDAGASVAAQPVSSTGRPGMTSADKNEVFNLICILIGIACVYYVMFIYKPTPQIHNIKITPNCVSTGCGNLWRCSGSYYSDGVEKTVNG